MKRNITQARKNGGSIVISLTGFANEQDVFGIQKLNNNQIILTPIEVEKNC